MYFSKEYGLEGNISVMLSKSATIPTSQ